MFTLHLFARKISESHFKAVLDKLIETKFREDTVNTIH